jgi:predicted nucleic acid-binding Zn ribbon protein
MERGREVQQGPRKRSRKEHVMMFAFALALVGVVVLGSLNVIAAHAR